MNHRGEAEPHFFAALEGRRAVLGRSDPATSGGANWDNRRRNAGVATVLGGVFFLGGE